MDVQVRSLLNALKDKSLQSQVSAARRLGDLAVADAMEPLIGLLDSSEASLREECARALGRLQSKRALTKLLTCLDNESSTDVQRALLEALVRIGGKATSMRLKEILLSPSSTLHLSLLHALKECANGHSFHDEIAELVEMDGYPWKGELLQLVASFPAAKAEELLLTALVSSTDASVKAKAARALGNYPSARNWAELAPLLKADEEDVRLAAIESLKKFNAAKLVDEAMPLLLTGGSREREVLLKTMADYGSVEQVAPIVSLCETETSPTVLQAALRVLIRLGLPTQSSAKKLRHLASHPSPRVRANLAELFGRPGLPSTFEIFEELCRDSHRGVRRAVSRALARVEDDRAISYLVQMTEDRSAEVRLHALRGLVATGADELREILFERLADQSPRVRMECLTQLESFEIEEVPEELVRAATDSDANVRRRAARILRRLGREVEEEPTLELGRRYQEEQRSSRAREVFEAVLAKDPGSVPALFELATIAMDEGDKAGARSYILRGLESRPNHGGLLSTAADLAHREGKTETEISYLERLLDVNTKNWKVSRRLGLALVANRQWRKAIEHLEKVLEHRFSDTEIHLALGWAFHGLNDRQSARKEFEYVLNNDPFDLSAQAALAKILAEEGAFSEAAKAYTRLVEQCPDNLEYLEALGQVAHEASDWDLALTSYVELVKRDSSKFFVHLPVARIEMGRGHFQRAFSHIDRYLDARPDNVEALLLRADIYEKREQYHQALETCFHVHALAPQTEGLLRRIGLLYDKNGQRTQALECFRDHLKENPLDVETGLLLAKADVDQRHFAQAIQKYVRIMKLAPEDVRAPRELAYLYRSLGDESEALRFADRVAELEPEANDIYLLRAELYLELETVDKAKDELHRALKIKDDQPEVHRLLGSIYYREGSYTRVLFHLNRLPISFASSPSYCMELGCSYLTLGHKEKAREWLEMAHRLEHSSIATLTALAELELDEGETSRALGYSRELLAIDENHPDALRLCGFALADRSADEEAEEYLRKALVAAPANEAVRERLALVRFRLGRYNETLELYPELNLIPTTDPKLRLLKAQCYLEQGNKERADEVVEEALAECPFDTDALALQASVCQAKEDFLGAEAALNRAIKTNPTAAELFCQRGEVLLQRRCLDRSRLDLLAALERCPGDAKVYRLLGEVEIEAGRLKQALQHLDKAVSLRPAWAEVHSLRARIYEELGDELSALESLSNVCQLNENDTDSRLKLGTLLLRRGDSDGAREYLEDYLELSDDRVPALLALASLHEDKGNVTEARFYLREVLRSEGSHRDILIRLVELLFTSHHQDEAWSLLEETRVEQPNLPAELGQRALEREDYPLARDLLRAAVGRSSSDYESLLALARCHYLRNETSLARAAIDKVLAEHPDFARAHFQLGLINLLEENVEQALENFRTVVACDDNFGEAWLKLATIQHSLGRHLEAIEAANGAISAGASRKEALRVLARALHRTGKPSEAIEAYRELNEVDGREEDLLALAKLEFQAKRPEKAITLLRNWIASNDECDDELKIQLGRILFAQKEYDEAIGYLRIGVKKRKDVTIHRSLVTALLSLDRNDEAALAVRKLLALSPKDRKGLLAAGQLAEKAGNNKGAERAYKLLAQHHADCTEGRLRLANIHAQQNRLREALTDVRKVLENAPSNVEALILQAKLFGRLDMHVKARAAWEAVVHMPGGDTPGNQLKLCSAYRQAGEVARAARLLERLSNTDETGSLAMRERIELSFEAKNWSETLRLYRLYRSRYPHETEMAELAGLCHTNLGMTIRAVAELQKLIQRGLPAEKLTLALVSRYRNEGRSHEAEKLLRAALEREPDKRNLWFTLAAVQCDKRSWNGAEQSLLSLLRLNHKDQEAQLALGNVYEQSREYEKMRATYLELVQDNPYMARAYLGLGRSELLTGRAEQAKTSFHKAATLERGCAEAYMGLAEASRLVGDRSGAITAYREVLRIDGRNERALYELGTTYQSVQKRELAVFHLERLLEVAPPDSRYVGLARSLLEENRRRLLN